MPWTNRHHLPNCGLVDPLRSRGHERRRLHQARVRGLKGHGALAE